MLTGGLRIENIRVKDLYRFACNYLDNAGSQEIVPITKHRALAQSKNPYADGSDLGLFVAYDDKKCVGHQGLLPGRLWTGERLGKIYWLTGLYVLPEYRSRMIAFLLMKRLLSLNENLGASGYSRTAGRFLPKFGFQEAEPLPYYFIDFSRIDATALPSAFVRSRLKHHPKLARSLQLGLHGIQNLAYRPLHKLLLNRLSRRAEEHLRSYTTDEVDQVQPFSELASTTPCFVRGPKAVNWMLQFPWVRDDVAPTHPPYRFSDVRARFQHKAVELRAARGSSPGFVVFSISSVNGRTTIKLCDHWLAEGIHGQLPLWICGRYARRYKADRIEIPSQLVDSFGEIPVTRHFLRKTERRFLYCPNAPDDSFANVLDRLQYSLWDGDAAFT